MKKFLIILLIIPIMTSAAWWNPFSINRPMDNNGLEIVGAPYYNFQKSILPQDTTENIGTSTAPWDIGFFNQICLNGDCQTSWPSGSGGGGSGGGTFSTSTAWGTILYNYPNNDTDILTIGYDGSGVASSTNEAEYIADPIAKLAYYINGMKLGIGTTSPYATLSVVGEVVGAYFTGTTTETSTFGGDIRGSTLIGTGGLDVWNGSQLSWYSDAGITQVGGLNSQNAGQYIFLDDSQTLNGILDFTGLTTVDKTFTFPDKSLTFAGINNETFTGLTSMGYSSSTIYSSFITSSSTNDNIGTLTLSTTTSGCLATDASGKLWSNGSPCGSSSGLTSYDAWTHPAAGQSATTSLMQLFGQASTSQFTATSSVYLATLGGSVGIATTTPAYTLDVYGEIFANDGFSSGGYLALFNGGQISWYSDIGSTQKGSLLSQVTGKYQFGAASDLSRIAHLDFSNLTVSDKTYTFPDKSLTFAGINNETFTGLTSMGYSSSTIYSSFVTASTSNLTVSLNASTTLFSAVKGFFSSLITAFSTNPTVDESGELAINTTIASSSIRFYDGTAERNLTDIQQKGFIISTSTLTTFNGNATTTLERKAIQPITMVNVSCTASTTGTAFLRVGDGVNWSNTVSCSTAGTITAISSNGSFIMGESMKWQIGTVSSLDQTLSVDYTYRVDPD